MNTRAKLKHLRSIKYKFKKKFKNNHHISSHLALVKIDFRFNVLSLLTN